MGSGPQLGALSDPTRVENAELPSGLQHTSAEVRGPRRCGSKAISFHASTEICTLCMDAEVEVRWLNQQHEQFEFYDVLVLFRDGRQDLFLSSR